MGHRKKHAPRRGSLAYLPRKRAKDIVARPNFWPKIEGETVTPLGFAGYKAGMNHAFIIEDSPGSPMFGKEVCKAVTVLDSPPMLVCGVRAYTTNESGKSQPLTEAWASKLPKDINRLLILPKKYDTSAMLRAIEKGSESITRLRLIACVQPRLASVPQKRPDLVEIELGGGTVADRIKYAKDVMGKSIRVADIFEEGALVDVSAVTKGKGFQGPVKRWGIKVLPKKSRKTKRGVGAIGPWKPPRVMYTVPRAGQMGCSKRTEYNKRILKIGSKGMEITPKSGFTNYGVIKGDYVVVSGSIPGPSKRLVFMRYPARPRGRRKGPPKVTQLA
ncbi:MAG: 50S ribosomal protein L3 [Candidatus Bathyarchaeia archaeon]